MGNNMGRERTKTTKGCSDKESGSMGNWYLTITELVIFI